ncbi:transposon Tf2-1 polyprotein isoform X1 [Cucumis melo var. makuwa]|uniref:Transposon Tf2-1 polyprotein isoform X1 n=1 Tax=Cucumis melo var. makuwa TaxID=1194695 RepID=A0A5D3DGN4_CUCMM|nr:transposon Tf2-1 polyprotein isoform X1 [Cucumis melo var. makuwa]
MFKTLGESDEVVECRAIKFEGMTMAVFYEVDEVYAIEEFVSAVLDKFVDAFDWSKKLPRRRSIEHHIHLRKDTNPINDREHELYVNKKKCKFAKSRVEYLWHIILGQRVEVDPEKIKSIAEWLIWHYGCTTNTTAENGAFKWIVETEEAFVKLKNAMMTLTVFALPDFSLPFEIETDASGYGIRVVLIQAKRLIAYYSHTLALRDRARQFTKANQWLLCLQYRDGDRLENNAVDAISRMPPTMHLHNLFAPTIIDLKVIIEKVERDSKLQKVIVELNDQEEYVEGKFSLQEGMLRYKNRLVISKPSTLIPTILHTYHNTVFGGHSWVLRTYKRLTRELYSKGMKQDVKNTVKSA